MNMVDKISLLILSLTAANICGTKGTSNQVKCQEDVSGEIGTNVVVQCDITGDVELLYWFEGTETEGTLPILSLENGVFEGTEYNRGFYQLAENGWMTIGNVQLQHEGTYTLKVFFTDGTNFKSSSKISVYIRPQTDCPVIDSCNHDCEECHIRKDSDGTLHCSVNGARPKLNIDWEIVSQDSVNFVRDQPVHTEWGDTWNTSLSIEYRPAECDAKAVLRCVALNAPFQLNSADVVIQTGSCPSNSKQQESEVTIQDQEPGGKKKNGSGTLVIIPIVLVIAAVVLIGLGVFYYHKKGQSDDKKNILVQKLVNSYMDKSCVKPDKNSGRATYKNCACTYVNKDGVTRVRTVKDLYSSRFRRRNDRVLIVAPPGFGKSTTTKKILEKWSRSHHKYLLLYVPMDKLQPGKNLFEMVMELYAEGTELTTGDISELVKKYECFVLLGDLEEKGNHSFSSESEGLLDLSFSDLLEGNVDDAYRPITVWVTSRDDDKVNSAFWQPYTKATIKGELVTPV